MINNRYEYKRYISKNEKLNNEILYFDVIREIAAVSNNQGIEGRKIKEIKYYHEPAHVLGPVDIINIIFDCTDKEGST